jgi:ubiquinone/menaquinone biosynthesis C-methylase UbiE
LDSLKSTGERVVPDEGANDEKYCGHLIFYDFAKKYVKSKSILDDGCGAGYGTSFLANALPSNAIGLDRSYDAISYANHKYKKPRLSYIVSDGAKLPFNNELFEVVISTQVIEHIQKYREYLSEIVRVLKHSGILLIGTPNKQTFNPNGAPMPFHFKEFYSDEFKEFLLNFFENVETFGQYNLKRSTKRNTRESLIRFGQSKMLSWLPASFRVRVGRELTKTLNLKEDYCLKDFEIKEFDESTSMNIICLCSKKRYPERFEK